MLIWGYEGSGREKKDLDYSQAAELMKKAVPSANISDQERNQWLIDELKEMTILRQSFDEVAIERSKMLIESHERFRKVLGGTRYKVVEPVLPMDLMGIYIMLPDRQSR
ncbi:MAG: helicase, partial [Candidatus Aminicenantes bacterium]|nr:helicase [Candidatus Aminicenantes bacterium]